MASRAPRLNDYMPMNHNRLLLACALLVGCALFPHASHAAGFDFTLVSKNGQGKAFSTSYAAAYSDSATFMAFTLNPTGWTTDWDTLNEYGLPSGHASDLGFDPLTDCNIAAADSGLSSSVDTYCVFQGSESMMCIPGGAGDLGAWSGGVNAQQDCQTPPPDTSNGSWPPNVSSSSSVDYNYAKYVTVSLFQSPLKQWSLSSLRSAIQNHNTDVGNVYWNNAFVDSGLGGTRMNPPAALGYSDVCPTVNGDTVWEYDTFQPYVNYPFVGPASACNVYHHDGVPQAKPVAKLTASPASVVAGSASNLTYSCSGDVTSASINNGVGTLSSPASGSKSVSPSGTTTYTLTCTNDAGSSTATAQVAVIPALSASCSVSPASISQGGSATWTASPSGGTGAYAYAWSGTDSLSGTGQTAVKAYSATGTKTASVTVTSGTQSKTVNCSNSLTVNAAPKPDLTAGAVTPAAATAGSAVTLQATISNTNVAATGAAFTDLFQRATDSSGTGATDIGTYSSAALAAGGSNTASKSYTFTAGTWYVRACADKSSAGDAGDIAESNEGNNCGAWSKVAVTSLPPTCTLSASPADKVPSTLTWSSTNATSCTGGGFSTGNATGGTKAVSTAGNYTLSCSGSGGSCTDSVSLAAPCTNATATISADKTRIQPGDSVTLSYSGTGTDAACTVTGPGISVTSAAPTSCTVGTATVDTPALSAQSTYTVTCGSATDTVIINVIPGFSEF